MRILLDTVSGLLSKRSAPAELLRAWLDDRFELVTATEQLDELARALAYEHLQLRIPEADAIHLVQNIDVKARLVGALPALEVSADPADNVILAIAVAGQADLIVSGDQRAAPLGAVKGIPILTARAALARLKPDPADY